MSRSLKTIAIETAQHARERNARLDEISEEHASRTRQLLTDQAEQFDATLRTFATQLAEETRGALKSEINAAMAA